MPLDDGFQAATDLALIDMAQRPRPPVKQAPAFSVWKTIDAAPRGVSAGLNEVAGSVADIAGAFGSVVGALGDAGGGGMFGGQTERERAQANTARDKLLNAGPDYNTSPGRGLRDVAKDYMPDPVTSHWVEQATANLFRVGFKAYAGGKTLGFLAGAGAAGLDEGFTTSDDLGQKGVDLSTRTQVGGVTAAATAFGLALPVAGTTIKGTVGLAVAGGPATFMAQNEATREILKRADYSQLANQYDPLDPVGLTLSTLLPLGFGAMALRGARARNRVDAEAVDAARVSMLRESVDATRPTPVDDLGGAAAHTAAMGRAIDQMAAGEKVDVSDIAPARAAEIVGDAVVERLAPVARAFEEEMKLREPTVALLPDAPAPRPEPAVPAAAASTDSPGAFKSESPELDRAVLDIESRTPDLQIQLDGMEAPMTLRELMTQVRDVATKEAAEAPLIEAAANCFLRTGG